MSSSTQSQRLTNHLLSLDPQAFKKCTTHPFLRGAGTGTLPPVVIARWLSQDRLYAQSYIRFIGGLLGKIRLSSKASASPSLQHRIFDTLVHALVNIQQELRWFEDVARRYDIPLDTPWENIDGNSANPSNFQIRPLTRSYTDLFMAASSPAASLLEGLTVLFATEKCYLEAWTYARMVSSQSGRLADGNPNVKPDQEANGPRTTIEAMTDEFIPNWSNKDFGKFVVEIGELLDEIFAAEVKSGIEKARCEEVWKQVLWLEADFWPSVPASD